MGKIAFLIFLGIALNSCNEDVVGGDRWPYPPNIIINSYDSTSITIGWTSNEKEYTDIDYYALLSDTGYCATFHIDGYTSNKKLFSVLLHDSDDVIYLNDSIANTYFDIVISTGTAQSCKFTGLESQKMYYLTVCAVQELTGHARNAAWDSVVTK